MEFQWNKKQKDFGVSDKEIVSNPRGYHSYTVEGAIARILLEMTALHQKFHTAALEHTNELNKIIADTEKKPHSKK